MQLLLLFLNPRLAVKSVFGWGQRRGGLLDFSLFQSAKALIQRRRRALHLGSDFLSLLLQSLQALPEPAKFRSHFFTQPAERPGQSRFCK